MKVVVLGAGSVGYDASQQLIDEGKDVVLIEQSAERAKYASSHLDCLVIHDSGNNFEVLKTLALIILMIAAVVAGMILRHYKDTKEFLPVKLMQDQ